MKRAILYLAVLVLAACQPTVTPHRVGSYNIRIITSEDTVERAWTERKSVVAAVIRDSLALDIVGCQEVSQAQEADMQTLLGETYTLCSSGEYAGPVVLYRTARYDCLEQGVYYLNTDPTQASIAWDAEYLRPSVWVRLQDKQSKKELVFCATHLDLHPVSIREGARVNGEQLHAIAAGSPCILVGDMNCEKADTAHAVYNLFFSDACELSQTAPQGPCETYFPAMVPGNAEAKRIDFIYTDEVQVASYRTYHETCGRTYLPSDHVPVVCEVEI